MNARHTLVTIVFGVFVICACSWEACKQPLHIGCGGPMRGNEPTTMMVIFSNVNNAADVDTAVWSSFQPGSYDASKAHVTLSANSGYRVRVMLLDLLVAPTASNYDATPSVQKEGSSYLVCFTDSLNFYSNLGAGLNWVRTDMDNSAKPMPIGLTDSFWTGADSVCGVMAATLHHQYQVKNGDCEPGYIDIQSLDTVYISPSKS